MTDIGKLRAIHDDELELMLAWRNAPAVRKNMYTHHVISLEEHMAWWSKTSKREDQEYFMYEYAGSPSGIVGFTEIDKVNSNCSWAFYASGDAAKGTGIRMEVLALDYIFRELNLRKLYCEVLAFNVPVIKLHNKFGFREEGVFREHHKLEDAYVDIHRLGMLAPEWAEKREEMVKKANLTVGKGA